MPKQIKSHTPYPLIWWMKSRIPKTFSIETRLPIEDVSDRLFVAFGRGQKFATPNIIRREVMDATTLQIYLSVADVTGKYKTYIRSRASIHDRGSSTLILGVIYIPFAMWFGSILLFMILSTFCLPVILGAFLGVTDGSVQGVFTVMGVYLFLSYRAVVGPFIKYRQMRNDFPNQLQQILADGCKPS